jgi:alpha-tubulin suppressor-like RCC1 family protein
MAALPAGARRRLLREIEAPTSEFSNRFPPLFYAYKNDHFVYISWPPNRAEEIQKQQKQEEKAKQGGDPFTEFLQKKVAGKIFRCLVRYAEGKHFESIKERANLRYQRDSEGVHKLFTWGVGLNGRLGHGYGLAYATPHEVQTFPQKTKVVEVACGCEHTLVRTYDGSVLTWGSGDKGQLGITENYGGVGVNIAYTPQAVPGLKRYFVVNVSAGRWHNIVLTSDRQSWVWGANHFGQLGIDSYDTKGTPVQLKALEGRAPCKAVCGGWHSAVVTETGKMLIWGKNTHGQLGFGDVRTCNYPRINMKLRSIGKVRSAALGANHTLVVMVQNKVYSFGQGESGQLGHDNKQNCYMPEEVQHLDQRNICEVAAGDQHSLALSVFGEVWAWGGSPFGQLGHGGPCNLPLSCVSRVTFYVHTTVA